MSEPPSHELRAGDMSSQTDSPNHDFIEWPQPQAIVHWQLDPDEWRKFLEFDKAKRRKQDTREVFVVFILIALGLASFLSVGLLANSGDVLGAVGALVIFAAIIALAVIAHLFIQGRRYRQMESPGADNGTIQITPEGIWANGVCFDWGEGTAWRLTTVTPVLAQNGVRLPPGVPSYLEFKCRARVTGRNPVRVDKKWRVPVPRGKEDEAREVIKYFAKPSAIRDEFGLPAD